MLTGKSWATDYKPVVLCTCYAPQLVCYCDHWMLEANMDSTAIQLHNRPALICCGIYSPFVYNTLQERPPRQTRLQDLAARLGMATAATDIAGIACLNAAHSSASPQPFAADRANCAAVEESQPDQPVALINADGRDGSDAGSAAQLSMPSHGKGPCASLVVCSNSLST